MIAVLVLYFVNKKYKIFRYNELVSIILFLARKQISITLYITEGKHDKTK